MMLSGTKFCVCDTPPTGSAASSPVTSSSGGSSSHAAGSQVVADGALSCFVMKRADFERLLGPYEELWRYEALRKVREGTETESGTERASRRARPETGAGIARLKR